MQTSKTSADSEDVRARMRKAVSAPALVAMAAVMLLLATILFIAPDISPLERHRIEPAAVRWMPATWDLALRRPLSGERLPPASELPRGGGAAVQLFHRFVVEPDATPPDALWLPAAAGRIEIYVNGAPIYEAPEASPQYLAVPGSRSVLVPIAREYYHRGGNRLDVVMSGSPARALSAPFYLGPREELGRAAGRAAERMRWIETLFVPIAALAALAALAAMLATREARPWLAAAAAATALGTRAWLAQPEFLMALGRSWGIADRLLLAAALLAAASLWPLLRERVASGTRIAARARGAIALAAVAAATALLAVWGGLEPFMARGGFQVEAGYALGAMTLMAFAAGAGAFVAGRRAIALLRDQLDLSRLVRRQREEIDSKTQALQQEMRRGAVLEERQRLARDMHDGIGGQLVSLIARVRSRRIGIDRVEDELVSGLTELRLVVDSLDAAGDSLADALAIFRMRAQPQAEAAGMEFVWAQPEGLDLETDNPRWTLNVYRLLQEAMSNAVRHSRATRLEIRIELSGAKVLTIEFADDGIGMPAAATREKGPGKGLANMKHRAAQLGGRLEIGAAAEGRGTRIRLHLPIPAPAPNRPRPGHSSGEISPS